MGVCEDESMYEKLQAKSSQTIVKKLWYDEKTDSSLLECHLITGRTHQIRVHLSYIGFPIINDDRYGGKFWGNFIVKNKFPEIWNNQEI